MCLQYPKKHFILKPHSCHLFQHVSISSRSLLAGWQETGGTVVGNRWELGGVCVCVHTQISWKPNSKSITECKICEEGWAETKEHRAVQTWVRVLSDCPNAPLACPKCQENAFWAEGRMNFPCSFCHWPLSREYEVCSIGCVAHYQFPPVIQSLHVFYCGLLRATQK